MAAPDRDLWASIKFGPLSVDLSASGHGYSPDLVHDLLARLNESFSSAMETAVGLDVWPVEDSDEDDLEDDTADG